MNDLFLLLLDIYYFYIILTKNLGHLANYKVFQYFQALINSFFYNLNYFFEILKILFVIIFKLYLIILIFFLILL